VAQRALDIVGAGLALVLLAPLMAAIALAIKLTSPGPVLFAQERIGRHGRPFTFYKFRSMVADSTAEPHREFVREFINGKGRLRQTFAVGDDAPYKLADDPRVTRVGRFLRKYSLDELPQFWNVLVGDMSLVGPRPALPYEVDEYRDWHRRRLALLPGVSGLWQIDGRSRVSFDEMVFQDVMYGYARSVLLDVMICLRTLPAALMGRGAK
jgi:lipopolysaccharide/colanic/teichoic acid biosynthesis glycosyltransferase